MTEAVEVVERVVEVTAVASRVPDSPKNLVICQAEEPDSLYPYGTTALASLAVQHAIFTSDMTSRSYAYQADGLKKLPSLADGDAQIIAVEVRAGDRVLTADDVVKSLAEGDIVRNAAGEEVVFAGEPLVMDQITADFTLKPRVWSDGEPVKASDSVYGFTVSADPDTPWTKYTVERTATYEATGELTTRWTGIPGFRDTFYFTNFWRPLPEHLWGDLAAAELLEAERSSRLPVGDGPFRIEQWMPGDSIRLVPNEHYYRAGEGLPHLDSLTYRFVADPDQLLVQLLSGQCDIGTQDAVTVEQAPLLIESEASGDLAPYFQAGTVYEHIDFNIDPVEEYAETRYDWFEDVRVRQAMMLCTDRQRMVDEILFGRSEVVHTYVPPSHPLYPAGVATEWPFDPAAGNALLDEAGYERLDAEGFRRDPSGARFAPELTTATGNAMRHQLTQMFRENMAACGIDVQLVYLPGSEWYADGPDGPLFGRRYDLGEFAWQAGFEPACDQYTSEEIPGAPNEVNPKTGLPYGGWSGQRNNTGYANPAYDDACERATQSLPGLPAYDEAHKQAQVIFSEALPAMPLFTRFKVAVTRPGVVGFGVDPTQPSELYNIYEIDLER